VVRSPHRTFHLGRQWLCVSIFALASVGALAAQRASFRSEIEVVLLSVTVTGPGGRYVPDLKETDFQVLEEGRLQNVSLFSLADTPLSVSLLLDTSASMKGQLPLVKRAALDFISRLRPHDVAQIVSFNSRAETLQPLTADRDLLDAAIRRLRPRGETALYNSLYIILKQLAKEQPRDGEDVRRHVIVILSDGEDTSSLVTFDHVLDLAKHSQTVIYTILCNPGPAAPRTIRPTGEFVLRQFAHETGGRLFVPRLPTDLAGVYSEIANELTNQYVLGYLSDDGRQDGRWRRVSVQVRGSSLQARTRAGYYAPTPLSRAALKADK
jgi:Ca-activated chloride channel family protein